MLNTSLEKNITSDRIQDTLYAFMRSQILFTAIDLEVFTGIAQGANTLATLQQKLDLDERGLRILLNGLTGIGFLQKDEQGAYQLPPDVAKFLVRDSEDYMGGMVHHCKRLYENWEMLKDAVCSGQPVGGAQSLAQLEAYFAELVKGLYVSNYPTAQKLANFLQIGTYARNLEILDVAGGSAVWSIAAMELDQGSKATVLDFPTVIHVAEEYVNQHQLGGRYQYWPVDLEDAEFPENRYDLALMANICHTLGPYATQNVFCKLASTLKPGGKLAIVDFVPDENRTEPGWPLVFSVNMLITTPEGDVFTGAEYEQWLKNAGFSKIIVQEIESDVTAIVAIK